MGSRGMIDAIKFNRLQKSKRRKLYDREQNLIFSKYGQFADHKTMKNHEFAAFQKELHLNKKKEKKRKRLMMLITVVLTVITFLSIPYLIYWFISLN